MDGCGRHDSQRDRSPGGNDRCGRTGGSNYDNDRGYANPDAYARPTLAHRRGSGRNIQDSSLIPTVHSTRRSQWTGPNYAAPMAPTNTGTGRQSRDVGRRSSSSRALHPSMNYTGTGHGTQYDRNGRMERPPVPDWTQNRRRAHSGRVTYQPDSPMSGVNAIPLGRPMADSVPRRNPRDLRRVDLDHRRQTNSWLIGDIVNIDVIKASYHATPATTTDPQTGSKVYTEKCHHDVPSLGQVIYCEARHGVIIAIHYGDSKLVATVLPIFSYGNAGLKNKNYLFASQHLSIINRSEQARLRAAIQQKLRNGDIQNEDQGRANPYVPDTHTLFVNPLDDFSPGQLNSLVVLSKSVNVYLDHRVRGPRGALEEGSRDTLRKVWQMYNAMSSLDQQDLVNFDCSEFPWLRAMAPNSANSTAELLQQPVQAQPPAVTQPAQPQQELTPPSSNSAQPLISNEASSDVGINKPGSRKRKEHPAAELTPLGQKQKEIEEVRPRLERLEQQVLLLKRYVAVTQQEVDEMMQAAQLPTRASSGTNRVPTAPVTSAPDNGSQGRLAPKRRKLTKTGTDEVAEYASRSPK